MGTILFVEDTTGILQSKLVLKYCKDEDSDLIKRFRREVRLLSKFKGNKRIAQILDDNLAHDPPFFVMHYYPEGDLSTQAPDIKGDLAAQEAIFIQMMDCVAEIHGKGLFHRDIKPQNFLRSGGAVVLSDFGLSMEVESMTAFTTPTTAFGTQGYIPPEYMTGGFKEADAAGDIFMLGKSFYALLTGNIPIYLVQGEIPGPLFHVIERCCETAKGSRYSSINDLRQGLAAAFDVLLQRGGRPSQVRSALEVVINRLEGQNQVNPEEVRVFLEGLLVLEDQDQQRVCLELPERFFTLFTLDPLTPMVPELLKSYGKMVRSDDYGWSFAETIANNMRVLVQSERIADRNRAMALELAIHAAIRQNRFAAMDTCKEMLLGIASDSLGLLVRDTVLQHPGSFLSSIDEFECRCEPIRKAISELVRLEEE